MFYVDNNNIVITKGDSGSFTVELKNSDGSEYRVNEGDSVIFTVKRKKEAYAPILLEKHGTEIVFAKEDTEGIPSGKYVYDIMLSKSAGERYTAVEGLFEIRKAVHKFER